MSKTTVGPDTVRHLTIAEAEAGQRLDVWLHAQLPAYSRSRLQGLMRQGHVTMDGTAARPHSPTRAGAEVIVTCPPPTTVALEPEAIPIEVLYEDCHLIVVNKAAGMVVHPAAGNWSGTLVNALLFHCRDLAGVGGELRPGIVHRLDKDTSGVMVAAKTDAAVEHLVRQFKSGCVQKEYAALVRGAPYPVRRRIESPIGRSRHDRKKMSAQPARGRRAVTHYEVVEAFGSLAAHVAVRIETGRTHQIRVHMAHVGHPVLGDAVYGRSKPIGALGVPPRQLLHARRLALRHPGSTEPLVFDAPIPQDMADWIEKLKTAGSV